MAPIATPLRSLATSLVALACAGIVAGATAPLQQERDRLIAPSGPGSLRGLVVSDAGTGEVVRRATVSLSGTNIRQPLIAMTDEEGRFAFDGLGPGRYSLTIYKAGFVRSYFGSRRAWRSPGVPIELAAGEHRQDLVAVLQRGSAIAGRVTDEQGQPLQNVRMQIMQRRIVNGEPQIVRAAVGGSSPTTDDRGAFRIWGLAPGEYLVAALPPATTRDARLVTADEYQWAATQVAIAGRAPGLTSAGAADGPPRGPTVSYSPVYYPGTPDGGSASIIEVGAGQERTGVDFALRFVPTAKVRGTAALPAGAPTTGIGVMLSRRDGIPGDEVASAGFNLRASVNPQGLFEFPAVGPGVYVLAARASSAPPTARTPDAEGRPVAPAPRVQDLWAEIEITVDGQDIDGLTLAFHPGMSASGRVAFDGDVPASLPRMTASLRPATPARPPFTNVTAGQVVDGRFTIAGVPPGRYLFTAPAVTMPPQGEGRGTRWIARSAIWNGRDLLDEPIDIQPGQDIGDIVVTYTDRSAELTGAILDGAGKPASGYFVMLFTTDSRRWTTGSRWVRAPAPLMAEGRFRFADLPPGEYLLAALTDFDQHDVYDHAFLEQVAQVSIRLTLADGERKVQDIKLAGG